MFEINLPLDLYPIESWGYQQAFASNRIAEIKPYNTPGWTIVDDLHNKFCESFGISPDNKQTFHVRTRYMTDLYFSFHDNCLYVGTTVVPYRGDVLPKGREFVRTE